jgi:hypothetical protein
MHHGLISVASTDSPSSVLTSLSGQATISVRFNHSEDVGRSYAWKLLSSAPTCPEEHPQTSMSASSPAT